MVQEVISPRLLGALASSVLLWASFSRGLGWPVWGALVPLFWALSTARRRSHGVAVGVAFGALFSALEYSGVLGLRPVLGLPVAALSLVGIALVGAIWGSILGALGSGRPPWSLAGLWTLVEVLRASGPWGVSVGTVPIALVSTPFLPAAAVLGPWALGLGASLTNGWLASALGGRRIRPLIAAVVPPLVLAGLGAFAGRPEAEGEIKVALVQSGLSLPERLHVSTAELFALYSELLSEVPPDVDLVVLPEDAVPRVIDAVPRLRSLFQAHSRRTGAALIVGGWSFSDGAYYNTAFLFLPTGEIRPAHRKVRLLPFGEYVPLRGLWERLGLGTLMDRLLPHGVAPGGGFVPAGPYGVMICSESMFSGVSRELVRKGARVLIALTNDSWFGRSRLVWEHFLCGALRAAETGRAFLQAAVTGISGGISLEGTILGTVPPFGRGTRVLRVPLHSHLTPYVLIGDWPVIGLAVLLLIAPLCARHPGRLGHRHPSPGG